MKHPHSLENEQKSDKAFQRALFSTHVYMYFYIVFVFHASCVVPILFVTDMYIYR